MFVLLLTYSFGLDPVNQHLVEHRAFLDKYYSKGNFICSGARIPRTGGVIICKAKSKTEVEQIISEDPFFINNAVEYEIIEFEASKFAIELQTLFN
ncbi:MAG: YciI family protein [Ignavibacteria bacterium]|nr:YciI family protein [Ignavibacteria bacterium]